MSELLTCLYNYVMKNLSTSDPEYESNRTYSEKNLQLLADTLNKQQKEWLSNYTDMHQMAKDAEQEAVFFGALQVGLYLGSLYHA